MASKPVASKAAPVSAKATATKAKNAATSPKSIAATPTRDAPVPSKTVAGKPAPATRSTTQAKAAKPHVPPPVVPRKPGKVAVALVSKPSIPAPKGKVRAVAYKTDDTTGRPVLPKDYKPAADEEYMSTLQLEYFRQRLQHWRADLVEESKQTIENLKEEVRDVGDEAERATRETENSLELRTRDRYRKLIGKIDSTMKRLDNGDYGYCVDTGEDIGLDRLEARLTAERTIDAQERWEHMQKQMGD